MNSRVRNSLSSVCVLVGIAACGCDAKPLRYAPPASPLAPEQHAAAAGHLKMSAKDDADTQRSPRHEQYASLASSTPLTGISETVEIATNSVVNVYATREAAPMLKGLPDQAHDDPLLQKFFDMFPGFKPDDSPPLMEGLGSGFLVSTDGLVVTNAHVVQGAMQVRVVLTDGREFDAIIIGLDLATDLALLQISSPPRDLQALPLADSERLRVGEFVIAIGNPYGIGQTVTLGIVSATGRGELGIFDYENFIQTDAAINPGNSGGPLLNLAGEVVGVNAAILSETGSYAGIGFAIPASTVAFIIDELQEHGRVVRGFLGVRVQSLTPALAEALHTPTAEGVVLADVERNGPAALGGLQRGDVVTTVDGVRVLTPSDLRERVATTAPGSRIWVQYYRGTAQQEAEMTVEELRDDSRPARLPDPTPRTSRASRPLGISLAPLSPAVRGQLDLPQNVVGVLIETVLPGSIAARLGLRAGDVWLQVDGRPVQTVKEGADALGELHKTPRSPLLLIWREGATFFVVLPSEE